MADGRSLELESERYATFGQWPSNAPVCVDDLVKNGFFATGNWLEVECNWCHVRLDMWQYGDSVSERHRRCSPVCSMVLAPHHCGNVPLIQVLPSDNEGNNVVDSPQQSQDDQCECPDLLQEANRLKTFKNWPNPNITPQALAKAGFYYLNRADQVKCAWCNGVVAQWEKNDNAFDEHQRFFPNCPRVQMGPLIEFASKDLNELGVQPTSAPKQPKYACLETRLRTFVDWPIKDIQPAEALAQAGLYYQRIDDQVRCFHCNIGLRSWQKDDEPWHEHAKWSPQCQFVLLSKGIAYVLKVRESTTNAAMEGAGAGSTTRHGNIDELMSREPAREALALGIAGKVVRNTIERKLSSCGRAYETLDELLHAIFDEAGAGAALEVTEPATADAQAILSEPTAPSPPPPPECCSSTNNKTDTEPTAPLETPCLPAAPSPMPDIAQATITSRARSPNGNISLEEENRQLRDARLCKVCLDDEVGVVFLPCGHLATCNQCAPSVTNCPMCRAPIKGFVRTFLS
ncbi:death-associated inhibitor of apoptosis 2 [Scaptodrosophila lebanonensis]|uniref:Death-associated inhibitor of apoptosis 2 n=1 Tax=Drosophila lebanonensis TaxID=7225 RepID=A0A6J2TIC9_DROLE|nr:death-associated inhibitor of apoptosis 2 [Scaptodrosophila lebanonensis]